MSTPLLHLISEAQWRQTPDGGAILPGPEGFVHLSASEQVHRPANRLYPGRTDVLLLCVDPAVLDGPVRWEHGVAGDPTAMRFPHLYGVLPTAAVTAVRIYLPNADGVFTPPSMPPGW